MPSVIIDKKRYGIIGASSKRHKKKKRGNFKSKTDHDILFKFHKEFSLTGTKLQKLELLYIYSHKFMGDRKYSYKMRRVFNEAKQCRYKIYNRHCKVCESKADVRHHVIPIKHGGDNFAFNIVYLCNDCHAEIHEWLKPGWIKPEPTDYLTEEFKNVVSN